MTRLLEQKAKLTGSKVPHLSTVQARVVIRALRRQDTAFFRLNSQLFNTCSTFTLTCVQASPHKSSTPNNEKMHFY